MIDEVKRRLESFGYTPTAADNWMIGFCVDKVLLHIKNNCNVAEVPGGLWRIAVDMVCGEFLFAKKQSGQSVGVEFEAVVKSIAEGDTTIAFETKNSAEAKYDSLVAYLMHREVDFAAFRRIKW